MKKSFQMHISKVLYLTISKSDLVINNWSLYRNEDEYAEENKQAPKEYAYFMYFI